VKIAISARGSTPSSEVDERFGRTYWLLIFCDEQETWLGIDNAENRQQASGAGVRLVELLVEHGVKQLLTGETGPKAYRLLQEAGIAIWYGVRGSAAETLADWQRGELYRARAANDCGSPNCLLRGEAGRAKHL